ncbi:MAG: sugar ABC transporter permease, partial [Clostridia bacterium]|nr:sugar ABC transporter permease [Clostridia bacterium]
LPNILPMILMMFVINIGTAFVTGYDNILLLYMPSTYNVSDTVYTYTYRQAFGGGISNYSLSAASGLFQSLVGTVLLVSSNALSRKVGGSSLF